MNHSLSTIITGLLLVATSVAQQPEFPKPQQQHEWLKQFEGKWTSTSKTMSFDDQPAMECSGKMESQMLGGFWAVNRITGDMGGVAVNAIQTLGYDSKKKTYVGTWVDSMMDHMWHYTGKVDATGKKLVLVAEGPNFMTGGKLTKFRDSYEFQSADIIITTSEIMNEDGSWITFL